MMIDNLKNIKQFLVQKKKHQLNNVATSSIILFLDNAQLQALDVNLPVRFCAPYFSTSSFI